MAGTIAPRMTVSGIAHKVTTRDIQGTETTQARKVADVVVLTDGGGFAEVYIDSTMLSDLPGQGERVLWSVDVALWNRRRRDGNGTYATLFTKLIEAYDASAPAQPSAAPLSAVI